MLCLSHHPVSNRAPAFLEYKQPELNQIDELQTACNIKEEDPNAPTWCKPREASPGVTFGLVMVLIDISWVYSAYHNIVV